VSDVLRQMGKFLFGNRWNCLRISLLESLCPKSPIGVALASAT
jgi:hypothetical protein